MNVTECLFIQVAILWRVFRHPVAPSQLRFIHRSSKRRQQRVKVSFVVAETDRVTEVVQDENFTVSASRKNQLLAVVVLPFFAGKMRLQISSVGSKRLMGTCIIPVAKMLTLIKCLELLFYSQFRQPAQFRKYLLKPILKIETLRKLQKLVNCLPCFY